MPGPSDILDIGIGIAWVFLGFPLVRYAWLFSQRAFEPLQMHPPFWARALVWCALMLLYVLGMCAIGSLLSKTQGTSHMRIDPTALGVLIGLVLFVVAVRNEGSNNRSGHGSRRRDSERK